MAFIAINAASALPITQRGYRLPISASTVVDTLDYSRRRHHSHFLHGTSSSPSSLSIPEVTFRDLLSALCRSYLA